MKAFSLNGEWTLEVSDSEYGEIPAVVPGSVYTDLLRNGRIPDPFYRDNELDALRLMEHSFRYRRCFPADEDMLRCDKVLLRCEGLDTLATVWINGRLAGRADNMHRIWEYDVKELLHPGENRICVELASPTRYIRESYKRSRADGTEDAMRGFPNLRKAHCMFGWDWGPRLPDAGIWRPITLLGVEKARLRDVLVTQVHEHGTVRLRVESHPERMTADDLEIFVRVTGPDGRSWRGTGRDCEIRIDQPRLWWPAGFGEQPLYRVEVTLSAASAVLYRWEQRIGLRTMEIRRRQDRWGESFCHCVNGVELFAMGADYIPEDNLLPRMNRERTRRLLEDARAANMNCIRVWGGGFYPDDWFFDLCDELGLLVWQDFMFACAVYNLTPDFEANIEAELRDNIRRLRHHASLALWCGNNEMEQFVSEGQWVSSKRQTADYIKMYEYLFPRILREEDPQRFYWPASPSSGGSFDAPQDPNRGDVHYWEVWHGLKPFTDYRKHCFRYVSEFGFQSFPCLETIESFTLPEDRNIFSYVMEKHQRNASANGKIVSYLAQMYRYPGDLDTLIYASQLLQAQAIQYGVEHWRRHRGRCMGAVIWQLNDCWPVASWSSIDYYGRWKALHYYAKRFFAPVLISCHEEGLLSQLPNLNAEPEPVKLSVRLNVSNETRCEFRGLVRWALRRPDASIIREGSSPVTVPALSACWLPEEDFSEYDPYAVYFSYELLDESGAVLGSGSVLFCPPKHFRFEDPKLSVRREGEALLVSASAFARSVELRCGPDVLLSDNFFDLNGEERKITILRGSPEQFSARSVFDIR